LSALSPTVELGAQWPPLGIEAINAFELPLLNTVLLLASGKNDCLKCKRLINITNQNKTYKLYSNLPITSVKILSTKRIGPHNYNVLSLIIGSLLGDGHMEKDGHGSRICFYQKGGHIEYIIWLHKTLLSYGYCRENIPQIQSRIINDKLVYYCRFRTFTYSSFNWIYDEFYHNKVKRVPRIVDMFMSPLALSVWIMDDGTWIKNRGISLATNSYTLSEVKFLIQILKDKFALDGLSAIKAGGINQYMIYIPKRNLATLYPLIKEHIHPMFLYKLVGDPSPS
jgi:ubiquinol-cytochrome c reductase cytochrome b subunit